MSEAESHFLSSLDILGVMEVFERAALANESGHALFKVSTDKHLTQALRLALARIAGQYRLSQAEWASMMLRQRGQRSSFTELVYDKFIQPHINSGNHWRQVSQHVDWKKLSTAIQTKAWSIVESRERQQAQEMVL